MTSIILAGGRSSRLGRSKALQLIQGKSLVQWVIDRLAIVSAEIIIVTSHGEAIPSTCAVTTRTVADVYPGEGALAGIYSGLVALSSPRAIVVGCDTPFLSVSLLEYMTEICSPFDAVVPRVADKVEPLCAVYSQNCLGPIKALLEQNELRISKLFDMVKVSYIEENEINRFDPEHLSFFNVNSQDDLTRARRLATARRWLPIRNPTPTLPPRPSA